MKNARHEPDDERVKNASRVIAEDRAEVEVCYADVCLSLVVWAVQAGAKSKREHDSQEASDSRGRENSTIHNYEWYISEPNHLELNHLTQWLQRCARVCLVGSKPW